MIAERRALSAGFCLFGFPLYESHYVVWQVLNEKTGF